MSTNKMVLPVLLVAFFIRVYATNELAIDHDEYDVYRRVLNDELLWEIPVGNARLNHHLLALLLARGSMDLLGNSLFSLRWPSIFMSVLSIVFIYKIGSWLFDKRVGVVAALLLTFNPFAIYYTHNSRGYLAMMFYILLAYYLAIQAIQSNQLRYWVAIGMVMSAAVYNHLYAGLGWLGLFWLIFIWSLQRKQISLRLWGQMILTMSISLILALALFSPILWRAFSENGIAVEMQRPSVAPSPFWTLSWFSGVHLDGLNPNQMVFYLLIGLVALTSLLIMFNQQSDYRAYYLLGWFFLPLIVYHFGNWLILSSIQGRPRYFSFILPFFLLILALSPFELQKFTEKILPSQARTAVIYYLILPIIVAFWITPVREMYKREAMGNWPAVSDYLSRHMQPSDIVLCESYEHEWWKGDYYDLNGNCRRNIEYWLDVHQIGLIYPVRNLGDVSSYEEIKSFDPNILIRSHRIWIVFWGIPPDENLGNQALPEWDRFGRTDNIPPSPVSNAVEALAAHIEQLDYFSDDPTIRLIHHARLAQLANIQGQTKRAVEQWDYVEKLKEDIQTVPPEIEQFLEAERRVLNFQPLLR